MEEAAKTLAQTAVQDSHIIRHPSPSRDIAPATSADRPPVHVAVRNLLPSIQFSSSHADLHRLSKQEEDIEDETASEISLDESPHPVEPRKTRRPLPPIPDLRFEQAYLKQLEAAQGSVLWMIIITIREQVLFPGVQGFLWALGIAGIRSLRATQAESGRAWGSWIRDWFSQLKQTDTTMTGQQRRRM